MSIVPHLGEIGTTNGILKPFDLTLERDGAAWNGTSYTNPVLKARLLRTKAAVAPNGTAAITNADPLTVRYTPGASDPIYAEAGVYEAWFEIDPPAGGDPEPSGLFRYTIRQA